MSKLIIRDLHEALTLDNTSLSEIRGGMFGGLFSALASYGTNRRGGTLNIDGESTDTSHDKWIEVE